MERRNLIKWFSIGGSSLPIVGAAQATSNPNESEQIAVETVAKGPEVIAIKWDSPNNVESPEYNIYLNSEQIVTTRQEAYRFTDLDDQDNHEVGVELKKTDNSILSNPRSEEGGNINKKVVEAGTPETPDEVEEKKEKEPSKEMIEKFKEGDFSCH